MSTSAVLVGLALLAANGAFVAAEFALLAARRSRLEQLAAEGHRAAVHALDGVRELSLMLAAAQLGITMCSLGLGAVAEPALERGLSQLLGLTGLPAGVSHALAFTLALSIVVFLHMVVGEMAPKSWAIAEPERSAMRLIRPFRAFASLVRPFLRLLNAMANGLVRLVGVQPRDELAATHSPGDLMLLFTDSAQQGTLPEDQSDLFARALDLTDLDAESAMVPRGDIVAVPADADIDELERLASQTGRSRIPVYDDELDRIRGILHVKDLLAVPDDERAGVTAATLARPALVAPESRPLESLMLDMRRDRQHVAIVVDEFGTVTGLVALEDLLEELIGEFEDESDRPADASARSAGQPQHRRADGALLIPGALRPDELADRVGLELPEGEWETVAGYVISELGRLPEAGDAVRVGDLARLEVEKMDGHRIVQLALHQA
ncbi:MAG TPA: hemolysin family protein [Egibacteraceae bacterium]|nr:hemolysin family protein [Egibacteraceae bacterium]